MATFASGKRIAVLRGGPSEEYQLSMTTGADIIALLGATKHGVDDIVITKSGEWLKNGIVKKPQEILDTTDIAFLALHGAFGEDGTIQRILTRHGTPYTGSGVLASSIGFNKMMAKEHLKTAGVTMPRHMRISRDSLPGLSRIASTIEMLLGPRLVIKPNASGSSFGLEYADGITELHAALEKLLATYDDLLIEERIVGTDVTCAFINDFREENDYVFPPLQLKKHQVDDKLDIFTAEKIVPANISKAAKKTIEDITKIVHKTLGCSQFSRADFVVTEDGTVYFLEINTLPSLNNNSPFMFAADSVGADRKDLLESLITTATYKKS